MSDTPSDTLNVSELLSQTNSILYETPRKSGSDIPSVFSTPVTSQTDQIAYVSPPAVDTSSFDNSECTPSGPPHPNIDSTTNMATSTSKNDSPADKSSSNNEVIQILGRIELKITSMDTKLAKLDTLEKKVDQFDGELKRLWTHIEDKTKRTDERVHLMEERVDGVEFASGLMQDKLTQMEKERDKLKDQVTYLQSQSMRNNLIFCGIPDVQNEKPEETESKLRQFIEDKLEIAHETVSDLKIERAHRMGPFAHDNTRKIVCKFNMFTEREMVRRERGKLKETDFYLHEQFPPEIVAKRKTLVPKLQEAIRLKKRAWISYDTLYIDGKRVESE